jgi:tetratricopeptide (TPR) repeat protein
MRTGTNKKEVRRDRRHLLAAAGLCVLTLAAYSNSFSSGFVFDNKDLLLQDPRIREATRENVGLILQHTYWWPYGESGLYRPFATLSYLFNYAVLGNGEHPEGYHWINLLLHLGNVLLVYALARRLLKSFWPPVFAAALWAVHPVLTESVTNIVGRVDLLAAMAVLSGLLFYLKSTEARGTRRWMWLAALMAVTFLGVFSKESAVVILGVIALYELVWWRERRNLRGLLFGCAAIAPPLLAMWYARSVVVPGSPQFPFVDNPLVAADFWTARLTALKVIARYLGLLVWPAHLSADYSYAEIALARGSAADWLAWSIVAVAIAAVIAFRRNRTVLFAAGFAAVAILPTANLLFPIGTIMAERFLYLPAIAASVCLVMALYALPPGRRNAAPIALCLITVAFAVRTWVRNTDWLDDLSSARAMARTSPESYKGHALLASALYDSHAGINSVIEEAEKSLAPLDPLPDLRNFATPYQQAGLLYLAKGDTLLTHDADGRIVTPVEARRVYQKALRAFERCDSIVRANNARENEQARARGLPEIKPLRYADLYRLLSEVELRLGDAPRALEHARYALDLSPFSAPMYLELADVQLHSGHAEESAVALMEGEIVTSDPGLKDHLVQLYRDGLDPQGCAAVEKNGQITLDPACDVVHRHLCAGAAGAAEIYTRAGRADLAASTKELALQKLGCGP